VVVLPGRLEYHGPRPEVFIIENRFQIGNDVPQSGTPGQRGASARALSRRAAENPNNDDIP